MRSTLRIRSMGVVGLSDSESDSEDFGPSPVLSSFSMQNALSRLSNAPLLKKVQTDNYVRTHTCEKQNGHLSQTVAP